jgi:hypothetical protein
MVRRDDDIVVAEKYDVPFGKAGASIASCCGATPVLAYEDRGRNTIPSSLHNAASVRVTPRVVDDDQLEPISRVLRRK